MKKNVWVIFLSLIIFDVLFYKQELGLNIFLFNVLLAGFTIWYKPELIKKLNWIFVCFASLSTSLVCLLYGDALSIFANIVSLAILSGLSSDINSSVITAMAGSCWSFVSSPFYMLRQTNNSIESHKLSKGNAIFIKLGLSLLVISIVLTFFFIYRGASVIFESVTNKINLNFISFQFIFFTLWGMILIYAFFNFKHFPLAKQFVDLVPKTITNNIITLEEQVIDRIKLEAFAGKLLFTMLNILLLIVNVIDIGFIIRGELPQGVTYTNYVHQGVGMLILSIILAISIILFLFRNHLNYYKENKLLKTLALAWVLLNFIMVASTFYRNYLYVGAYGLTEKRIGVYIYLLLATIGLLTTFWKVKQNQSNLYLFRINMSSFYVVLVISSFVSWDKLITRYDLSHKYAIKNIPYLAKLNNADLPSLVNYTEKELQRNTNSTGLIRLHVFNLHNRLFKLLKKNNDTITWQEWTLNGVNQRKFLNSLNLKSFYLQNIGVCDMEVLKNMTKLEELHIKYAHGISNVKAISGLKKLYKLELSSCRLENAEILSEFSNLEYLDISGNSINDYRFLEDMPKLNTLIISKSELDKLNDILINLPQIQIEARDVTIWE